MYFNNDLPGALCSIGLLLACLIPLESVAGPTMSEIATEAVRPAGTPDYADVCLRYGWVRSSFPSVEDAKAAIAAFHATRVDWFYPGPHMTKPGETYVTEESQNFIDWCHANGMKIGGAINTHTAVLD